MTKIYIHSFLEDAEIEDLIRELNDGNCIVSSNEKEFLKTIKIETEDYNGTTFLLEISNKGKIETNPKIVFNKK